MLLDWLEGNFNRSIYLLFYTREMKHYTQFEVLFDLSAKISKDGITFEDVMREIKTKKVISLNRELVLPWSWKKSRLVTCITQIGGIEINGKRFNFNPNLTSSQILKSILFLPSSSNIRQKVEINLLVILIWVNPLTFYNNPSGNYSCRRWSDCKSNER